VANFCGVAELEAESEPLNLGISGLERRIETRFAALDRLRVTCGNVNFSPVARNVVWGFECHCAKGIQMEAPMAPTHLLLYSFIATIGFIRLPDYANLLSIHLMRVRYNQRLQRAGWC